MPEKAFTIIEVAIALAILVSATVSVMLIRTKLLRRTQQTRLVAAANVLAGKLAAQYQKGTIKIRIGRRLQDHDDETGFHWKLYLTNREVKPEFFLRCLKVEVFQKIEDSEPIVAFDAWLPIESENFNKSENLSIHP